MTTASMPADAPGRQPAFDEFERRYGQLGAREIRTVPFQVDELRDTGDATAQFAIVGHAAVFEQWSLDLGFFREKIARGAFDDVIATNPDVWHLWDHDTRWVLSRTTNKTLELSIDPRGLRYYSRPAKTSYAADLRVLIERGDVNQSSFAFTVAEDEWVIHDADGEEQIERTIIRVAELYDVTTTAMGAYPQTDASLARTKVFDHLRSIGRLPETAGVTDVAPGTAGATDSHPGSGVHPRLRAARAKAQAGRKTHLERNV